MTVTYIDQNYQGTSVVANQKGFVVEWIISKYSTPENFYRFTVMYHIYKPGVYEMRYYAVSDLGIKATVGAQDSASG